MARLPALEPGCGCVLLETDSDVAKLRAGVKRAIADFMKRRRGASTTEVYERRGQRLERRGDLPGETIAPDVRKHS